MKFERTFLRIKVGRRIFTLFIVCALVPIGALAVLSFNIVTKNLDKQSSERRHQASKAMAMAITERLQSLKKDLRVIVSELKMDPNHPLERIYTRFDEGENERFRGMALLAKSRGEPSLSGNLPDPPELTPSELEHLASGNPVLSSRAQPNLSPRMFMSVAVQPSRIDRGILIAEINPNFLWGKAGEKLLPPGMELCVLDHSFNVLFNSHRVPASFLKHLGSSLAQSHSGKFSWNYDAEEYLGTYWSIFFKSALHLPQMTVVMSESKSTVFSPVSDFKRSFFLVILMAFWIVLFLSISQIRRSLVPLERLQEATKRIAKREFHALVRIPSGDEFEELAESFNTMAIRLGRQFHALTTIAEIDRTILSILDTEKIVATLLMRMRDVIPSDGVSITIVDTYASDTLKTYVQCENSEIADPALDEALGVEEMKKLRTSSEIFAVRPGEEIPSYLEPLSEQGIKSFLVLPIFVKENLRGILGLGFFELPEFGREDLSNVRQLADQIAVALSNAHLMEELDRHNWHTLIALARAIDAKSPWTSGHSERVTQLALKIGRVMKLSHEELNSLHRGGLLHDIGKIGIPAHILDKPEALTEEERRTMREHVQLGVRILEPIEAYADVLPLVLQHHEWFDGSGYPNGLTGEEIDLKARIFTVADCYDALNTDRPYRSSVSEEGAIDFIRRQAGKQFDPKVVGAFLHVVGEEMKERAKENTYALSQGDAGIIEEVSPAGPEVGLE
ncbi:MAG: HD domain-containing protein [Candidatus Latescibacteria bacterium]|nr:HD domain-containing protein [Candidatus Latescibacterota bacterium]NIO01050.1 HD domain-containing protein [Candidatus Latescibacterota bacterium]NIO27449.1 HD domain-containing protein [Candidatus Latescibacterota bacterium]NIO54971.1 HD domain-containing protein [Candidatus Latescibacterota bacterium]NIT01060.1 HD domain-containing protein [Candidatus Latescibacterota bacterium]